MVAARLCTVKAWHSEASRECCKVHRLEIMQTVYWAFQDRLDTLQSVREAGISVCAGGIIGLGEGPKDRVGLIHQLATLPEHPESVPINALVAVAGKLCAICVKQDDG